MNQKTFSLTAGVVFLLITLGHMLRLTFSVEVMVGGRVVPMWASWAALILMAYLSYEGFRLGTKSKLAS
jgi:hypothetical protein